MDSYCVRFGFGSAKNNTRELSHPLAQTYHELNVMGDGVDVLNIPATDTQKGIVRTAPSACPMIFPTVRWVASLRRIFSLSVARYPDGLGVYGAASSVSQHNHYTGW
jgi:hypothetical protein